MKKQNLRHRGRIIFLSFLTIIFVGVTGLLLCNLFAPQTFQNIIAPFKAVTTTHLSDGAATEEISDLSKTDVIAPTNSPVITEFTRHNGQELLTGGIIDIIYYNQSEEPWGNMPFGTDPISSHGCGPTTMAMVVSSLTSQTINPKDMAQWAFEQGYCAPGSGSYRSIVEGTASAFGLEAKFQEINTVDELRLELASGKLFVALMSKGHFTNSGHFILLRGITLDGNILVADPNSRERSLATWDPQILIDEAKSEFWGLSSVPQE